MDAPYRWRVADNQTQRTLGGNIMELHETGPYVLWHDYARLQYKSQCQTEGIDAFDKKLREAEAEVERLTDCKADVDRFKAEVERLTQLNSMLALRYDATNSMLDGCAKEIEEMEAEVERLTKAGDAMAKRTEFFQKRWDADELCPEVEAWNAAKEGKPQS
jgi:chromosome segregation ATPase